MKNYTAIVVDCSCSMSILMEQQRDDVNSLLDAAEASEVDTRVVLVRFGERVVVGPVSRPSLAKRWRDGDCGMGSTALRDAIGKAIEVLKAAEDANDPDTSFLVSVVTDGEENLSKFYTNNGLRTVIMDLQRTGRWTFVFRGPTRGVDYFRRQVGLLEGNVMGYEVTPQGYKAASVTAQSATRSYYAGVKAGRRSTSTFFVDADKLKEADLKKLTDMSGDFFHWKQDKSEWEYLGPFCEKQIRRKDPKNFYRPGNAHYLLVKSEKVQDHKQVLVLDTTDGQVYGGPQARALLGLPNTPGDIRVRPDRTNRFKVFIQSTSTNRKLHIGDEVLYLKG